MKTAKPRIFLISRNFPPIIGGIEQLMKSTYDVLAADHEVLLLGPKGSRDFSPNALRVVELPAWAPVFISMSLLVAPVLGLIYRPSLVIAANGLIAPASWLTALLGRCSSAIFLYGLDITVNNFYYRQLFLPFARRMKTIIVISENTRKLACEAGMPPDKLRILHPCIREPSPGVGSRQLRLKLGALRPYILYAGRVVPRKGLREFIEACGPWMSEGNINLVVAGDAPTQSAASHGRSYAQSVITEVEKQDLCEQVHFLGLLQDEDMAACFELASVHIMPLVNIPGDVEGFGMVAVEAASYGTPTVAFDCGGVSDAIGDPDCLISATDYKTLEIALAAQMTSPAEPGRWQQWANRFYPANYGKKLLKVLNLD